MSILIKGMEMPKENEILVFDMWHGKMYARFTANTGAKSYEVVPLPEGHGRLIDADALLRDNPDFADCDFIHPKYDLTLRELIEDAPTIVPAEGGTDDA